MIVQGPPLWVVRALALVSLGALLLLAGMTVWDRVGAGLSPQQRGSSIALDQRLDVVARETTRLEVATDGTVVLAREVAGGEELVFEARDRIEVSIEAASDVSLTWNGEALVPQGRQDLPRRIVLVDDEGTR
jgi:hypothetical protein